MTGKWVEPDVRDEITTFVLWVVSMSALTVKDLVARLRMPRSRFYAWVRRRGLPNRHNGKTPKGHWILPWERQGIIEYCKDKLLVGYRRLTYMMLDADIVAVSPATTYRVLKTEGLLNRWAVGRPSLKGTGFVQPTRIHQHWHADICYVNILGMFFFLVTVMDGFSRFILHHELRAHMEEYDVEIVLRRAKEAYPEAAGALISDHGPQFIAKDFKKFLKEANLQQVLISVGYPQSNGKLERYHRTIKEEKIRTSSFVDHEDARRQIADYVRYYNEERLHAGIYYLTPKEVFEGKMNERLAERQEKLDNARMNRLQAARRAVEQSTLYGEPRLSICR